MCAYEFLAPFLLLLLLPDAAAARYVLCYMHATMDDACLLAVSDKDRIDGKADTKPDI